MTYTDDQISAAITAILDNGQNKASALRLVLSMLRLNLAALVLPAGANFLFGAGPPTAAKGTAGDLYDNTLTGDRYQKRADGTWQFQYNAKGPTGKTPVKGVDYRDGTNGLSAYELWLAAGNVGSVTTFLAGLGGGSVWHQQATAPTPADGANGDFWQMAVSLSTERRWQKVAGQWVKFYDNTGATPAPTPAAQFGNLLVNPDTGYATFTAAAGTAVSEYDIELAPASATPSPAATQVSVVSPGRVVTDTATTLQVTITTADNVQATSVTYYQDGQALGTVTTTPFALPYHPTTAGTYSLKATVKDSAGASVESAALSVTVVVASAPQVQLSAPGGVITGQPVTVTAAVQVDGRHQVASVQFLLNGQPSGAAQTAAPFRFTTTPSQDGNFTVGAQLTDDHGLTATATPVTILAGDGYAPPADVALFVEQDYGLAYATDATYQRSYLSAIGGKYNSPLGLQLSAATPDPVTSVDNPLPGRDASAFGGKGGLVLHGAVYYATYASAHADEYVALLVEHADTGNDWIFGSDVNNTGLVGNVIAKGISQVTPNGYGHPATGAATLVEFVRDASLGTVRFWFNGTEIDYVYSNGEAAPGAVVNAKDNQTGGGEITLGLLMTLARKPTAAEQQALRQHAQAYVPSIVIS